MEKRDLKPGDLVQINPEIHKGFFPACFMVVTEPKSFGAQGYIAVPGKDGGNAYYRATWEEMEYIGRAEWQAFAPETKEEIVINNG